jgi:hypothetical protein
MTDRSDPQLDSILRDHLASKLDVQLGRAADHFLSEVGNTSASNAAGNAGNAGNAGADEPVPAQVRMRLVEADDDAAHDRRWRRLGWSLGLAGAAIAASIAIAFVLPMLVQNPNGANNRSHAMNDSDARIPPSNPSNPMTVVGNDRITDVEHALSWRTVDQGTVYLNELPMRSVVRQANETVRWYDPASKARVELTVPRDEVTLVGYQSQ